MLLATWALCSGHSTHTSLRASFSALDLPPISWPNMTGSKWSNIGGGMWDAEARWDLNFSKQRWMWCGGFSAAWHGRFPLHPDFYVLENCNEQDRRHQKTQRKEFRKDFLKRLKRVLSLYISLCNIIYFYIYTYLYIFFLCTKIGLSFWRLLNLGAPCYLQRLSQGVTGEGEREHGLRGACPQPWQRSFTISRTGRTGSNCVSEIKKTCRSFPLNRS